MENALKYSDDDVKITVVLSEHDNHLSIAIQDTGWGIPQKAQKKLGKQFYRVQIEGKKVHPDHGLGLCSVKQLVKEMDGSVTFRSTVGIWKFIPPPLQRKLQQPQVGTKPYLRFFWPYEFRDHQHEGQLHRHDVQTTTGNLFTRHENLQQSRM